MLDFDDNTALSVLRIMGNIVNVQQSARRHPCPCEDIGSLLFGVPGSPFGDNLIKAFPMFKSTVRRCHLRVVKKLFMPDCLAEIHVANVREVVSLQENKAFDRF